MSWPIPMFFSCPHSVRFLIYLLSKKKAKRFPNFFSCGHGWKIIYCTRTQTNTREDRSNSIRRTTQHMGPHHIIIPHLCAIFTYTYILGNKEARARVCACVCSETRKLYGEHCGHQASHQSRAPPYYIISSSLNSNLYSLRGPLVLNIISTHHQDKKLYRRGQNRRSICGQRGAAHQRLEY